MDTPVESSAPGDPPPAPTPPIVPESDPVRAVPALPEKPIEPPPLKRDAKAVYVDVEGTLADITLTGTLYWMKRCELQGLYRLWQLGLLVKAPYWFLLRALSNARYSRSVHYEYAGMNSAEAAEWAESCYRGYIRPRIFPHAIQTLRDFRAEGYQIVLVADGLDFIMLPLARELRAGVIAPQLVDMDGEFTGAMSTAALQGELRANALRAHAEEHGIDLAKSRAYANAGSDIPMLECVGTPVAVRPDRTLAAAARRRDWPVESWREIKA